MLIIQATKRSGNRYNTPILFSLKMHWKCTGARLKNALEMHWSMTNVAYILIPTSQANSKTQMHWSMTNVAYIFIPTSQANSKTQMHWSMTNVASNQYQHHNRTAKHTPAHFRAQPRS
jgi:hypothetical protein